MAGTASRPGDAIVGINVTPLVDVVLVLLIVLMVTASYTVSQAVPMTLPQASTGESVEATPLTIAVNADGSLFLDGRKISEVALKSAIKQRAIDKGVSALIAADGAVPHRSVIRVIDLLRAEGVTRFAMNVAPEPSEP